MHFTLRYKLHDILIQGDQPHVFDYGGPHGVVVTLRAPNADERAAGCKADDGFSLDQSECDP
jgi:hypothetical protein